MTSNKWISLLAVSCLCSVSVARESRPETPHEDGKKGVQVTGKVYLGEKTSFVKAVTIEQKKVFEAIPAFQAIKKENVEKDTARYHFLIQEANRVFKETLKKVAKEKGFDLVVEKDGIKLPNEAVSEVTQEVIDAIN